MKIECIMEPEAANKLRKKIRDNDGYCLCQIRSENSKCMCHNFIYGPDEVCSCGLYRKTDIDNMDYKKVI